MTDLRNVAHSDLAELVRTGTPEQASDANGEIIRRSLEHEANLRERDRQESQRRREMWQQRVDREGRR